MKGIVKQFLCGLIRNHSFKSIDTQCHCDAETKTVTITETCCKCGKQFSFSAPYKNFGLKE